MAPTGDMFQKLIDELFNEMSYLFNITDDILIGVLNKLDKDHDTTLDKVPSICRLEAQQR